MATCFEGCSAVITGAGSGIGLELGRQLAKRGAYVVLNDLLADRAESAARQVRGEGGRCVAVAGDAADLACIHAMVNQAVSACGKLDMAIANAGLTLFSDVFSCTVHEFQRVMSVNLQGSFFLAQAAACQMRQTGGGKILLMSSVLGLQPYRNLAPYCMTKAALRMLAGVLALELAPHGITVNALAPGATVTKRTTLDDPHYERHWRAITPSGRPASVKDIAASALFLQSVCANHVTGQTLVVDGGWSITADFPPA